MPPPTVPVNVPPPPPPPRVTLVPVIKLARPAVTVEWEINGMGLNMKQISP
jgi:hypothetical protein